VAVVEVDPDVVVVVVPDPAPVRLPVVVGELVVDESIVVEVGHEVVEVVSAAAVPVPAHIKVVAINAGAIRPARSHCVCRPFSTLLPVPLAE